MQQDENEEESEFKKKKKKTAALHHFLATGCLMAQAECAYIITCSPGLLQRALLIDETERRGGKQAAQEELSKALPHSQGTVSDIPGSLSERSVVKYFSKERPCSSKLRPEA